MKKKWMTTIAFWIAFVVWTIAVVCVDVSPIGPDGSEVGFSALNGRFHHMTGVHMTLYTITDWLGLVPVMVGFGFAALGLCQWIRRKRITKVDADILLLGGFYVVTIAAYLLFETVVINYRPVLIMGRLEASYPSSTTLLVLCVMLTALRQIRRRVHTSKRRRVLSAIVLVFAVLMVVGRLLSGVHWLTDIVGAVWCSGGLVLLYDTLCCYFDE